MQDETYVHGGNEVIEEPGNHAEQEIIENGEYIGEGDRAEHYGPEGENTRPTWPRTSARSRSPPALTGMQYPRAVVNGGILYVPDEQTLTERALRRHRRLMERVEGPETHRGRAPSRAESSAPTDVLLTCSAWPVSPPPAQPDMTPRPIEDDLGPVGAIRAYPYTKAVDVVEKVIEQNEIGTRYEVAYFEARKGQDRVACQYALGSSLLEGQMPRNTFKMRYTPENEIGGKLGK